MNNQEKAGLIRLKIGKLLQTCSELEKELEVQRQENQNLRQQLAEALKSIEKVEEQNKISKLADGIHLDSKDRVALTQTLNRYIREVDECLKLLNQLPDNP